MNSTSQKPACARWLVMVIPAARHKYLIGMQTWAGPARESFHYSYSVTAFQHLTSQQIVLYILMCWAVPFRQIQRNKWSPTNRQSNHRILDGKPGLELWKLLCCENNEKSSSTQHHKQILLYLDLGILDSFNNKIFILKNICLPVTNFTILFTIETNKRSCYSSKQDKDGYFGFYSLQSAVKPGE